MKNKRPIKYSNQLHPVRFVFLKASMKIKDQQRLKEYFESKLKVSIRCKRENGRSVFMSSEQSNLKCRKFFYKNFEEITENFNIGQFEFDLTRDVLD